MILEFLPEVTRYYEERVSGLGLRFRLELETACAAVARQPMLWRQRKGSFRRINLPAFPYYIAYFIRNETVFVAAVAHAKRHPDYWKRRLV